MDRNNQFSVDYLRFATTENKLENVFDHHFAAVEIINDCNGCRQKFKQKIAALREQRPTANSGANENDYRRIRRT
jgi:hypothetical protein